MIDGMAVSFMPFWPEPSCDLTEAIVDEFLNHGEGTFERRRNLVWRRERVSEELRDQVVLLRREGTVVSSRLTLSHEMPQGLQPVTLVVWVLDELDVVQSLQVTN